jgi:hypothetical protein
VYGAYTTNNKSVKLIRYGGGSVSVGSLKSVTPKAMGVATSLAGRIWVMWGDDSVGGGVAVTRSNKAVTRFEPIQKLKPNSGSLYRLSGDGRLGPLDLLVGQIPNTNPIQAPGSFYARVLPVMSVATSVHAIKNKKLKVVGHKLEVAVSDAGDAVAGASVAAGKKSGTTNSKGVITLTFSGASPGRVSLTVTKAGYTGNTRKITI